MLMHSDHYTTSPSIIILTLVPVLLSFPTNHRVTSTLPHIVDVDWRLDYYIKVIPGGSLCSLCLSML